MTPRRKVQLTKQQIERGVRLRQVGESWYAIARALGVGWWACRATIDPEYREAERQRLADAYARDPEYFRRRNRKGGLMTATYTLRAFEAEDERRDAEASR